MNWLTRLFEGIAHIFNSRKWLAVEKEIQLILPYALNIVQSINRLAPNKTLEEINKIANLYALPTLKAIGENPEAAGNALLNLASAIVAKQHPTTTTSILNTVIQLAVVGVKAQ